MQPTCALLLLQLRFAMALPARLSAIAASISQCFELPVDEAASFVRRSLPAFEALLAGGTGDGGGSAPPAGVAPGGGSGASASPSTLDSGASHLLVYYQPRMRKAEVRRVRAERVAGASAGALAAHRLSPPPLLARAAAAGRRVRL